MGCPTRATLRGRRRTAVDTIVSLLMATVVFAMIFKILPDVQLRWRDMWRGAYITAVLFVAGQSVISLYLTRTALAPSYGAAGSLVMVLLWVYSSLLILLFGAALTRTAIRLRGDRVVPKPTAARVKVGIVEGVEDSGVPVASIAGTVGGTMDAHHESAGERLRTMTVPRAVRRFRWILASFAWLLAGCSGAAGDDGDVRALTGAHTRLVWVQADGTDPRAVGDQLVLMGLDSDDGRGERVILAERRNYVKPLLTPRGNRIVFSRRLGPEPQIFIVNWDGTGLRALADGFALAVWADPVDGTEWLYVGTDHKDHFFATVTRFPIDAPDRREVVWNKSLVAFDTFQVTADGRHAGGLFPWPAAGIVGLPNGPVTKLGEGCWTAIASVRGPLFWYFDGAHRNLTMVDVDAGTRWMVNINDAPEFDGAEVYHPRWTNHPRFLAISGPYNQGGDNQARTGGKQVEVYLGRFSEDYSRVEAWARVTHNGGGDSYPDAWIDGSRSPVPRRSGGRIGPANVVAARASGASPALPDAGRLVVNVRLTRPGPIPTPQSILPYRHALVENEYEILDVIEGAFAQRSILIAQWAIRDSRILAAARRSAGAAFTLTVERYDAHVELEGERLIRGSGSSSLPLYYDVTKP